MKSTIKTLLSNPVSMFSLCCLLLFPGCSKEKDCTCPGVQTCVDMKCTCPNLGFTGDDCGIEIVPKSVTLTSFIVLFFKNTKNNNGDPWDEDGSGPDLNCTLNKGGAIVAIFASGYSDADPVSQYNFSNVGPGGSTKLEPDETYTIDLLDVDGTLINNGSVDPTQFEKVGKISFVPYVPGEKFPTSKEITDPGSGATAKLFFKYDFE